MNIILDQAPLFYDINFTLFCMITVFGVSFVRCERCNFTNNSGINSRDEYGAAVAIYLVNQFGRREAAPSSQFIDW